MNSSDKMNLLCDKIVRDFISRGEKPNKPLTVACPEQNFSLSLNLSKKQK